jgi:hypothetical protein
MFNLIYFSRGWVGGWMDGKKERKKEYTTEDYSPYTNIQIVFYKIMYDVWSHRGQTAFSAMVFEA